MKTIKEIAEESRESSTIKILLDKAKSWCESYDYGFTKGFESAIVNLGAISWFSAKEPPLAGGRYLVVASFPGPNNSTNDVVEIDMWTGSEWVMNESFVTSWTPLPKAPQNRA